MQAFPFDTNRLKEICREYDVSFIGIFGSMAKGKATESSDIDLIVKFSQKKGLLTLVRLERELSIALGKKIDLLTESAISPYLREQILNDLKVIYDSTG